MENGFTTEEMLNSPGVSIPNRKQKKLSYIPNQLKFNCAQLRININILSVFSHFSDYFHFCLINGFQVLTNNFGVIIQVKIRLGQLNDS